MKAWKLLKNNSRRRGTLNPTLTRRWCQSAEKGKSQRPSYPTPLRQRDPHIQHRQNEATKAQFRPVHLSWYTTEHVLSNCRGCCHASIENQEKVVFCMNVLSTKRNPYRSVVWTLSPSSNAYKDGHENASAWPAKHHSILCYYHVFLSVHCCFVFSRYETLQP